MSETSNKKSFRWLRILGFLILGILIFFILLSFTLTRPSVQNWAIDKVAESLSERLDAQISIDSISLDVRRGVKIWDVSAIDRHGDTLITGGQIASSLSNNISSLFRNELLLESIYLKDVHFNIINNDYPDTLSNWQKVLAKFESESSGTEKRKSFLLDVKNVELENFKFSNSSNQAEQLVFVPHGKIEIRSLNLDSMQFNISKIEFTDPKILLENFGEADQAIKKEDTAPEQPAKLPQFHIDLFTVNGGVIHTEKESADKPGIDFSNLDVNELNIQVTDIGFRSLEDIEFNLQNLSGILDDVLTVEKVAFVGDIKKRKIAFDNFQLKTNQTDIKTQLAFKFRSQKDFGNFVEKVFIDTDFDNSTLSINELAYLIPAIAKSPLIKQNRNEILEIDGSIKGRVNNFTSSDLEIHLSEEGSVLNELISFFGKVRVRNITDPDNAVLVVDVQKMNTSMGNLKKIVPNFTPPQNYFKLGNIDFSGRFEGFIYNFVAYGNIGTDLGKVNSDMQLDLGQGRNNAKYSGVLDLIDFDLAKWSDNPDFNKVSFSSKVKNGSGLTLNSANAELEATIQQFSFRGHVYEDLNINGDIDKNHFEGQFDIDDPFVKMDFNGSFVYENEIVNGDFVADIKKLDLYNLKLSKDTVLISGKVDVKLKGSNLDNFEGEANIVNAEIGLGSRSTKLDSIYLMSSPETNQERLILMESDLVDLVMEGQFNFASMVKDAKAILLKDHPKWSEYLKNRDVVASQNQDFRFRLDIVDSENLFAFLGLPELAVHGLRSRGLANSKKGSISVTVALDSLEYQQYALKNTKLNLESHKEETDLNLETNAILVQGRQINAFDFDASLNNDQLQLDVDSGNFLDTLGHLDFKVFVEPEEDKLDIHFEEESWSMLGTQWNFNEENSIRIGKDYINIKAFNLADGNRSIEVQSTEDKNVILRVADVDVALLNPFLEMPNLLFSGPSFINVEVDDIFKDRILFGSFVIPDLLLNDVPYGSLNAFVQPEDGTRLLRVDATVSRESDGQTVALNTLFNTQTNELEGKLDADNFQFKFFEFIIKNGISNTSGSFDLNCDIKGTLSNLRLRGKGMTNKGQVTVDYLANTFYFDEQEIRVNEKVIDVTGGIITDQFGNEAVLTGGLYHDYLKDLSLNINITGEEFLILNTTKKDNNAYYGTGFGKGSITFTGPFESPNILVNATTGPGTVLNIPVESSAENAEESFIQFVEKGTLLQIDSDSTSINALDLSGINLEMNLTITPDAMIRIIFDEKLNEVIEGVGRGNIQLISERTGAFDVFGQYTVETGKYLFTALGIVAKPFIVKRGGTITWTGDPLNATLNIEAEYEGLSTPSYNFIEEYLAVGNENIANAARQTTDVILDVILTGTLFQPEINFDIEFPDLQGEVRSFAENKMRILRSNPTDLNDQVAALLIFGSFLPSSTQDQSILSSSGFIQSGYNTLSEFVSNQLSYLLSGLLEEALIDNGLFTGIDFNIGFSKNSQFGEAETGGFIPDEVQVSLSPKFKNNRWSADLGTNYVRNSTIGISSYVFYDFVLEYALTTDRRLKLKIYGKNDYDALTVQRELKSGAGIRYRKEFGTLAEFKEVFNQQIKADLDN